MRQVLTREHIARYMKAIFDYAPSRYQLDFAYDCFTKPEVIAVFCRQTGKSETVAKIAVMMARKLTTKNPILVFAPSDRQAGIISSKISRTVNDMLSVEHFKVDKRRSTKMEFYFSNGSSIICQTTGPKGEKIVGYTAGCIILEEASYISDFVLEKSILPMGNQSNPSIIKIGTPKGKNHFFETYSEGISGNLNVGVHQVDWIKGVDAGILNEEYVKTQMAKMTEETIKTEYRAQFIEDQDSYFKYDLIESCISRSKVEFDENKNYFLGVDVARMGTDETVMIISQRGNPDKKIPHQIVKIISYKNVKTDVIFDKILELDEKYNFVKMYIDETAVGAGLVDFLEREYGSISRPKVDDFNTSFDMTSKVIGIVFSVQRKLDIYSNLKVLMEKKMLKYPRHRGLIAQLRDFRYEITDNDKTKLHHSERGRDDYCDALALAVRGLTVPAFEVYFADDLEVEEAHSEKAEIIPLIDRLEIED